jgi:hypothetical protein
MKAKKKKVQYSLYHLIEKLKKTGIIVTIGIVLFFISSTVSIITGTPILVKLYNENFRYKELMEKKVESLQIGAQISLFKEILGSPTFINDFGEDKTEYIFVNKYFYLDAITEKNDNVIQYTVTSRTNDFNPKFESPVFSANGSYFYVTLGKSKLNQLPPHVNADQIVGCLGANYFYYYEVYSLGNPTYYQSYAFGNNMSGYIPEDFYKSNYLILDEITSTNCLGVKDITEEDTKKNINLVSIKKWKESSTINTYLITAPYQEVLERDGIGVSYHQVRILNK